jgi:hypothetical protein
MKRTCKQNKDEWVFIVLNSDTLHFQILDEGLPPPSRHPRWIRVLLKVLKVGSKFYGL